MGPSLAAQSIDAKESYRWIESSRQAKATLGGADREADPEVDLGARQVTVMSVWESTRGRYNSRTFTSVNASPVPHEVPDEEAPDEETPDQQTRPVLRASDQVFVKDGRRCWFVTLREVRLFEAAGNYTRLYFGDETPLIHRSLRQLEERLDPARFFRASRQHILNLKRVDDVYAQMRGKLVARMDDGREIELSRRRSRAFRETMSL